MSYLRKEIDALDAARRGLADGGVVSDSAHSAAPGSGKRGRDGSWWAHALGGLSKISWGPFSSASAAKKFLRDRDFDRGPFKQYHRGGPDGNSYSVAWAGNNYSVEQNQPKPGRDVLNPEAAE